MRYVRAMRAAVALLAMAAGAVSAQMQAADDFESYATSPVGQAGGTGDWLAPWGTNSQFGGGVYLNQLSKIDGAKAAGLYGNDSAVGTSISRPFVGSTNDLKLRFNMRADYDVASTGTPANGRRLAFTVRTGNDVSHFGNQRVSFFFAAGSTNVQWYDGVDRSTNAVYFVASNAYDFAVAMNAGTRAYSFTASNRTSGASFSYAGSWTTGTAGQSLDSVAFMMRGPAGVGNDAYVDSISVSSTSGVAQIGGPDIREGDTWMYWRGTSTPAVQGTNPWYALSYSTAGWLGPSASGFGYGDCDDATTLSDMLNGYVSVFTRKAFVVGDTSTITRLSLAVDYDDGFVAYLNGAEVARRNLVAGAVTHTNTATANHEASRGDAASSAQEKEFITLNPGVLLNGTNVLAVSGHNVSSNSSDFTLIVELYTNVALVRGPFIQMPEPDKLTVAWRTAALADSAVDYGLDPGYGAGTVSNATLTRDHTIHIPGLLPGTTYYYRVRSGGETLLQGGTFRTRPATNQNFRFVVIGDFGQGTAEMYAIAALINGRTDFDAIMTVGDNVYGDLACSLDGAPGWYDPLWFRLYNATMRRVATFPTLGNHDVNTALGQWMVDYFRLPTNGPAGQIGKNYSFDFGNAHFVSIDTEPFSKNDTAVMSSITSWLGADLAAATQPWRIALLHRPPYTSVGGHDDEPNVKAMVAPLLAAGGVQLVLQGHNHWYERINAINGVDYITTGGGGGGLYTAGSRKEYSAALYDARHSYSIVDVQGTRLTVQQINDLDQQVDEFHMDIGHPFKIDGLIDNWSWLRAQNGLRLYGAIRGPYLYVATQDAGEGNDHFIYVADMLSTQRPANWAKSGTIMQWGAFLSDENDNGFYGWFGPNEETLTDPQIYKAMTSGLNNNAPGTNGVLEGTIDLAARFGSFPQQIYLAAAPYGNAAGGTLTQSAQVPAGNGNGDIEANEFLALNTRAIALDLPSAEAGSNAVAEAGMWVALDGSQSTSPSGLPLSYAWSRESGPAGVFSNATSALAGYRLTNNVAQSTNVVVKLTVNDTRFDSNDTATITFVPMVDTDGDGLSDQEELTGIDNALTAPDPHGVTTDPNDADSDDDGMSDGNEFLAGTDPHSAASVLKLVDATGDSTTNLVFRWSSVEGKLYVLRGTTNLLESLIPLQSNIPAAAPMNAWTVVVDEASHTFYVIEVQP